MINMEISLKNLKTAYDRKDKSVIELAAIGTFLHNIYNGIENILKQLLSFKNIKISKSSNWHKDLLNTSLSSGIISKDLTDELYKYLTFRHYFIHSYGFMLEEAHLKNLVENISSVWNTFESEIDEYLSRI